VHLAYQLQLETSGAIPLEDKKWIYKYFFLALSTNTKTIKMANYNSESAKRKIKII
jgi:hypothetical protein